MDAYDTIKKYYNEGFPQSDLRKFMGETDISDLSSGVYRDEVDDDDAIGQSLRKMCCFFRRNQNETVSSGSTSTEYTTLPSTTPKPSVSSY